MTKSKKPIIIIAVAVLAVAFIAFAAWNASQTQSSSGIPRNAVSVEAEAAHKETIVSKIKVNGVAEFVSSHVIYPEAQAIIKEVLVSDGDEVKAGQKLFSYDSNASEALADQLKDAELAARSARLSLVEAQSDASSQIRQSDITLEQLGRARNAAQESYDNVKALYDAGAISKNELDAASENLKKAEEQITAAQEQRKALLAGSGSGGAGGSAEAMARIQRLQASAEQAEARVAQIRRQTGSLAENETAPADGTVVAVHVKAGGISVPNQPLLEIADMSAGNIVIKANVPENEARNLALGQEAEIRCTAIGPSAYKGKVGKISSTATERLVGNTREKALEVEIECGNAPLKAGYSVTATIISRTIEDAIVVPLMATVKESGGGNSVFVVRDDYSVEKRMVELGEYSGVYVEADGINEGEKVVINPTAQIKEGVFVRPVQAKAS